MGVLWAFIAMASWGVGDFLIQRSARKLGDGIALFFICASATIFLFPFIVKELPYLLYVDGRFWLLLGASLVMLVAALLDFEALRLGKISVIEPIYALEVPVTVALSTFFLSEHLTALQSALVVSLVIGILFVSLRSLDLLRKVRLERGSILALFAALGMGASNFLFGVGARHTSPLLINWFTSAFIAITIGGYILHKHQWGTLKKHWKTQKRLIVSVSIIDNLAWISYSASTLFIPIAIATGISESYIALAALLGLLWNKEVLKSHQKAGLALTVTSAIALGFLST